MPTPLNAQGESGKSGYSAQLLTAIGVKTKFIKGIKMRNTQSAIHKSKYNAYTIGGEMSAELGRLF